MGDGRRARVASATGALVALVVVAGCTGGPEGGPTSPSVTGSPSPTTTSSTRATATGDPGAEPDGDQTIALPDSSPSGSRGPTGTPTTTASPHADGGPSSSATPSDGASTHAPDRRLAIVDPADGDERTNPVSLTVEVDGFDLVELGGSMVEDEGHLWAFVDVEPPAERVRLPESTSIVKSAESTIDLGELAPGEHTVTVLATHGYPVPFEPRIIDTVTFTVTG